MDNMDYIRDEVDKAQTTSFASREIEEKMICSLMKNPDSARDTCLALDAEDFYHEDLRKIYTTLKQMCLKGTTLDVSLICNELIQRHPDEYDAVQKAVVICSGADIFTQRQAEDYARVIRDLAQRRRAIAAFEDCAARLRDSRQDMDEVLDAFDTAKMRLSSGQGVWKSISQVLIDTNEFIDRRTKGQIRCVTTGLKAVDDMIGGFFDGEMTVIGARPSVGKSAFGAHIALNAARQGFRVGVVSREMTDTQYGVRLLSYGAQLSGMTLRSGEMDLDAWERVTDATAALGQLPISYMFTIRTVEELRREALRKVSRGEMDLLIVDYLQLLVTQAYCRDEHLRVGHISRALKDIAIDLKIPVIALAQVNRETDGVMPTLKSLRASGDIEQDADGVIFLHRPQSANDPSIDARDQGLFARCQQLGYAFLVAAVAKQRQGVTGRAGLAFDAARMRFYSRGDEKTQKAG